MADIETEELPVDDIAADIRSAAEEASTKALGDKLATPEKVEAEDRQRGPDGKFIKVEQTAPEPITDAGQKTEQPVQQSSAATPPSFLSAEAKAEWVKAPSAIQAALIKRDADAQDGARQWSEQRQETERTLAPLQELSKRNGIDWKDGLNRLLNVEASLNNPTTATEMVADLIRAYPIDRNRLAALVNGSPQPQRQQPAFDPNVIPSIVSQTVQQAFEERELNSTISGFATAKDASGQLTHPHFEKVKPLMGFMLSNNQASDMDDAYQKAIWMDPSMRPQQVQQVPQQVAKAKRAAISPSGAPNGSVAKVNGFDAKQTLDDDLREAFRMHTH